VRVRVRVRARVCVCVCVCVRVCVCVVVLCESALTLYWAQTQLHRIHTANCCCDHAHRSFQTPTCTNRPHSRSHCRCSRAPSDHCRLQRLTLVTCLVGGNSRTTTLAASRTRLLPGAPSPAHVDTCTSTPISIMLVCVLKLERKKEMVRVTGRDRGLQLPT